MHQHLIVREISYTSYWDLNRHILEVDIFGTVLESHYAPCFQHKESNNGNVQATRSGSNVPNQIFELRD